MTHSTMYPTTDELPPNVRITFRDEVPQRELRQAAERSVATLVAHSAEAVRQARAAESQFAKLTDAVTAPFAKLIEGDSEAVKALNELRTQALIQPDALDELLRPRYSQFIPPYDFSWIWHDINGHPPFNSIFDRPTGQVGLDARSGLVDEGGAPGFVSAHAGFGVLLRAFAKTETGMAFGSGGGRFSFRMKTVGVGSNATSEGGLEATALEDGRLIASSSLKLWRRRISGFEEASGGESIQWQIPPGADWLRFTMHEGREYTFNVGVWVFSDRSTGIGGGAVQSLIHATVSKMFFRFSTD